MGAVEDPLVKVHRLLGFVPPSIKHTRSNALKEIANGCQILG